MSKALPDVTIFKPLDNTKVYISIIIDNFSRFILGWMASPVYNASICLDNLKQVYKKYLDHNPHSALNGHTPYEIFHGIELDKNKIKQCFEQARINRIQENRRQRCQNCDD